MEGKRGLGEGIFVRKKMSSILPAKGGHYGGD